MSRKKKSILRSRFYQVYFAVVLLILIGMVIGRVWLNGVLVDYEASQPAHVAERVAALFEDGDYEAIYRRDTAARDIAGGDEAFYLESMQALANGRRVAWSDAFAADESERRYNVTLDGEKFATFTLVPSGKTTSHGNTLWQLGSITTLVRVEEPTPEPEPEPTPEPPTAIQCRIQVPTGDTVTVDGVTLTSENARVSQKGVVPDGFLPQGITALSYTVYDYTAYSKAPQVTVTDALGIPRQVTQSGDNVWLCAMQGDEAFQHQYGDAMFSLAKRIASVTASDSSVHSVKRYCADNSPAWTIFENYSNRWATPHSGTDFQNVVLSEFYVHSEDCFTCHIAFDHILKTKNGNQTYPTAYTFCVIRKGGKAMLYNLRMQ